MNKVKYHGYSNKSTKTSRSQYQLRLLCFYQSLKWLRWITSTTRGMTFRSLSDCTRSRSLTCSSVTRKTEAPLCAYGASDILASTCGPPYLARSAACFRLHRATWYLSSLGSLACMRETLSATSMTTFILLTGVASLLVHNGVCQTSRNVPVCMLIKVQYK